MPNNNSDTRQEPPAWRKLDRKRGIVTEDDRKFLTEWVTEETDEAPDKQTIRDKRYRIRERVKNAFLDFNHVVNLEEEDREKVFGYLIDEGGPTLQSLVEFLYLGITDLSGDTEKELNIEGLARMLERGIIEAERQERNYIANVSVNIDIERTRPDTETLLDKMLDGRGTIEEFMYYMENEGDRAALFNSVVEQEEPLVVTAGSEDNKMELLSVEEAREIVQQDTEILGAEDKNDELDEGHS